MPWCETRWAACRPPEKSWPTFGVHTRRTVDPLWLQHPQGCYYYTGWADRPSSRYHETRMRTKNCLIEGMTRLSYKMQPTRARRCLWVRQTKKVTSALLQVLLSLVVVVVVSPCEQTKKFKKGLCSFLFLVPPPRDPLPHPYRNHAQKTFKSLSYVIEWAAVSKSKHRQKEILELLVCPLVIVAILACWHDSQIRSHNLKDLV